MPLHLHQEGRTIFERTIFERQRTIFERLVHCPNRVFPPDVEVVCWPVCDAAAIAAGVDEVAEVGGVLTVTGGGVGFCGVTGAGGGELPPPKR
jgi:hypothetical protein